MVYNLCLGSPPHARGKEGAAIVTALELRITPACAGKSKAFITKFKPIGDHPRVRGEKYFGTDFHKLLEGSPPRARGKGIAVPDRTVY